VAVVGAAQVMGDWFGNAMGGCRGFKRCSWGGREIRDGGAEAEREPTISSKEADGDSGDGSEVEVGSC
jgi:hypothetical protein